MFLQFLGKPDNDAYWHQHTGYVPVTFAGFELSQQQGFYEKNAGADLPVKQLTRGTVTRNSHGPAPRAAAGDPQHHLRGNGEGASRAGRPRSRRWTTPSTRGNKVLREFEKSVKA